MIRALEFYCGIGGLHKALMLSDVHASVVGAFDWDQTSCRVYGANYDPNIVMRVDISCLDVNTISKFDAPLWLLSPSCQPYTVLNPSAQGANDPRAKSFLHLIENVLPELVKSGQGPRWVLVENVAGFETSTTRHTLLQSFRNNNYSTLELLLTPLQFNIPNSRLRYYFLAKVKPHKFAGIGIQGVDEHSIWRHIPGHGSSWTDNKEKPDESVTELRKYLDPEDQIIDHPCKIRDRVLLKWGRIFDIVLPSSRRTCCFTRGYTHMVEGSGSILQMNEDLNTTQIFDEFLTQQTTLGNLSEANEMTSRALEILKPLRLRYFSPAELLRLFHFEPIGTQEDREGLVPFVWPKDISEKTKYRLIGNSVNVEVVRRLINYLLEGDLGAGN